MEFKLKYRSLIFKYALLALVVLYLTIKSSAKPTPEWIKIEMWCLYAVVAMVIYTDIKKYRRFFTGKPILIVNDEFIYDKVKDRKYYWKDIEEVTVYEGWRPSRFDIKVYHPEQYLNRIHENRKPRRKDKDHFFFISISEVNVQPGKLKMILQKFSDAPKDR